MRIAVQENIFDTENIYKISKIYSESSLGFDEINNRIPIRHYFFEIILFYGIKFDIYSNVGEFVEDLRIQLLNENQARNKLIKLREELISIWNSNKLDILQLDIKDDE